jgi:predicted transcriptional regulator
MMNGTFLHEAEAELLELAMMQERLSEAETGEFVSGDLIEEWVGSWFTASELPPPDPARQR